MGQRIEIVRSEHIVTPGGVVDGVVELAADGTIAAVTAGADASGEGVLDARGKVVLPGGVDAHVHCNDPGRTEWEGFGDGDRCGGGRRRDDDRRHAAQLGRR